MQNEVVRISPVAVLVDGDNVSASHAVAILKRAYVAGRPDIRRVYCDMTNGTGWDPIPGYRTIHAGPGKNGADLLLAIDAMEMALTQGITSFVLVSSDSDFTHLATRLREMGCEVIGMGEAKARDSFRKMCSEFCLLETTEKKAEVTPIQPQTKAIPLVRKAMQRTKYKDGWCTMGWLSEELLKDEPGFDCALYGHNSLETLLQATGFFEIETCEGNTRAREKPRP